MRRILLVGISTLLATTCSCFLSPTLSAEDVDLRLRIAWGGAERTTWSGSITLDNGRFANLVPLGIENDEPGCVWLEEEVIHVLERSRRDYGGVDVSLSAPAEARLTVRLRSGISDSEVAVETSVGELVAANRRATLDSSGNYVLISRAPGDRMRVEVNRDHMVYLPGETVSLGVGVSPELLGEQDSFQLVAEVTRARNGDPLHTQTSTVSRYELSRGPLPIALPAPGAEGVYEARLVLRRRPGIAQRIVPSAGTSTIVARRVQFVVFDSSAARLSPSLQWEQLAVIDLANPNWSSRVPAWLPLDRLPGVPTPPSSNVAYESVEIAGESALVLPPPSHGTERSWYALSVSVPTPNVPYLVRLRVPADEATQVGLSVIEPNAAGYAYPITRDFGLFSRGIAAPAEDDWLMKQFLVWPKTHAPMLLITNEHPHQPARLGRLELHRARIGGGGSSESLPASNRRMAAVLVDRPWLPESTGAREVLDAANHQSVDDWQTFYEAATRLVDYVQLAGYNAAVLTAFADGSTIYPSALLQSTPRYDTGVLATTALDPFRKDLLELLFSAFDRADLSLYVGLEFVTPLPALERLRRSQDPQQSGIEWIGADGRRRGDPATTTNGGASVHYNLLNPDVQEALLQVVQEVVSRYGEHASLAGIALQLSTAGYSQLLEPQWGFDDQTIRQFEEDTGIDVPGSGPRRFAVRANFLLGQKEKEWIAWRADVVTRFYARLRDIVRAEAEHRALWILPTRLLDRKEVRSRLRPSPANPVGLTQILLEMGVDAEALVKEPGIVLLRPTFATPPAPVAAVAAELQVNAATNLDGLLEQGDLLGHVVYYPSMTRNRRLVSFDQVGFFGQNKSFTAPLTQMRPLGSERGRGLALSLAEGDADIFVEGGQTLVTEMDENLRRSLEAFRKLPSGDCKKTVLQKQPITVRTYHTDVDSFVCVINESPWAQSVGVDLEAPPGSQLLEIGTAGAPLTVPVNPARTQWQVELPGFGVYAARISAPSARVVKLNVEASDAMHDELAARIEQLDAWRLSTQDGQPVLSTQNAGFEVAGADHEIDGWQVLNPQGGTAAIDTDDPQEGRHCLRITSQGPPVSVASDTFVAPAMGRLSLSAHVRRSPESSGVAVLMILEDERGGAICPPGQIGGPDAGRPGRPPSILTQWRSSPYRYYATQVPPDADGPLRIRFEVVGKGTVWIDNVVVWDESLHDQQRELTKIIYEAQVALRDEAYSDCLECLEGFWPQYVVARARLPWERSGDTLAPEAAAPAEVETEAHGVADRLKRMVPRIWK